MRAVALSLTTLLLASAAHAQDAAAVLSANQAATGAMPRGAIQVDYAYAGQGLTGRAASVFDTRSGAFVDSFEVGPTSGANGFDGKTAWQKDSTGAVTPQAGGDKPALAINEAYRDANLWWRPDRGGARIAPAGTKTEGGRTFDLLTVTPAGGKPFEAWFDRQSHLLARTIEKQGTDTVRADYSDYRIVGGVKIPGKIVVDPGQGPDGLGTQTVTEAKVLPARPASAYAMPKMIVTDSVIRNPAGRTTVPFKLLNNHIYAEVKVNGKGPYLFIFDTGGHNLLTPPAAKALGIGAEGSAVGSGAGENTVSVGFAKGATFELGDLVMKDQAITILPFISDKVEGFPQSGMLGFELFRRFVTVIDYGAMTMTFIDPAKFDPKDAGTPVPFVFYDHLPQVKGTFEGIPGVFDIDTGSRVEITLTKPFVDAHKLKDLHPKGLTTVDGWGVGGRSISYVTRAKELTLGPVKIPDVVAGMATQERGSFANENYQGNVGSGLLKRFVVTFDYDRQVMYLKRIAHPRDVGTYDRAGMWINTSPQGFEVVSLTAGGPAEAAGLKVGDQITAVDGAAASGLAISDVRQKLRDPAAAKVALTVQSGGQSRTVDLALRDLI